LLIGRDVSLLHVVLAVATVWTGGPPPGDPETIALLGRRVFLGTERGLYRAAGSGFQPLFTRATVRDIAAGRDALLLATAQGLYEWRGDDGLSARPLASGADVRAVALGADGVAWAATEAGLFVREADRTRFRRVVELPALDVRAVRTVGEDVWASSPGTLWLRRAGEPFVALKRGLSRGWWEMVDVVAPPGATLVGVPRGLWRIDGSRLTQIELPLGDVRALSGNGKGLWVATARGVFALDLPVSADRTEASVEPLSAVDASDLAAEPERIWVASRQGVLAFSPGTGRAPSAHAFHRSSAPPNVTAVHRAVLDYLDLSPRRLRALERRARWAGLWPELQAGFTVDRDRDRTRERDQVVSSGRLFELYDSDRDHARALRFDLELVWNLERLASPSDALSVSKERREVVELVERLLDRVNGVFFEREEVLARLARLPDDRDGERGALELRAQKLTATLDGWTGGLFSREIARVRTQPRSAR
jgi:hypothetical protein